MNLTASGESMDLSPPNCDKAIFLEDIVKSILLLLIVAQKQSDSKFHFMRRFCEVCGFSFLVEIVSHLGSVKTIFAGHNLC